MFLLFGFWRRGSTAAWTLPPVEVKTRRSAEAGEQFERDPLLHVKQHGFAKWNTQVSQLSSDTTGEGVLAPHAGQMLQ